MRRAAILLCLSLPGVPLTGSAQDPPTFEIEGLVVTGTPVPRPLSTLGPHVTVLDGEDLRTRGITRVLDGLREVPGLSVVQGGSFGAITSVFLRGGESDHVQVLVDGVQVNQPGGAFDFASLTTENVERIEVVRGPASALYGSDAVAGVVHVITRTGSGSPRGSVAFRGGSFGSRDWSADLTGGGGAVSYAFALSRYATDGTLPFNNEHENTVFSGNVEARPDDATTARIATRLGRREYHFPTDGSGNLVDENAFAFGDEVSIGLDVSRRVSDRLELRARLTSYQIDDGSDDRQDNAADTVGFYAFTSLNSGQRLGADLRGNVSFGEASVATLGLELDDQSQRSLSESLSDSAPSTGQSANDRWNRGAYAHVVSGAGPLSANAGLRFEDNQRFGEFVTWQLGAAYAFSEQGRVRGAAGRGVKEPTFFENYATGFAVGNPDLDPERSTSWELGVEHDLLAGAVRLHATYFDQAFRDLIQFTFAPPQPNDPNYFNVAEANARGVEAGVSFVAGALVGSASATWLDTEVTDAGFDQGPGATFVEGEALLRRPEVQLAASLTYAIDARARLNAAVRRVGDRADRDFSAFPASPVTLEAYQVVDLGAEWTVREARAGRPGLVLTVRGENLLDASFEEVFGFRAPGRGLYAGGRVTFGAR